MSAPSGNPSSVSRRLKAFVENLDINPDALDACFEAFEEFCFTCREAVASDKEMDPAEKGVHLTVMTNYERGFKMARKNLATLRIAGDRPMRARGGGLSMSHMRDVPPSQGVDQTASQPEATAPTAKKSRKTKPKP